MAPKNKRATVRTRVDIPRDLHRRLRTVAAEKGCSARQLILLGIERIVGPADDARPRRRLKLSRGLIRPAGRRIKLTNEQAYALAALP
ncbi:MAG: hypothetical protein ACKVPX_16825 [Myxococcaceae bacterium]